MPPDNDYQILKLTKQFYFSYPNPPYKEILRKHQRSYTCLLFQTHYNYFICVPYRSNILHKYSYHFKTSARSRRNKSGLDYSKMIIIRNPQYVSPHNAIIDYDEFKETIKNINQIAREALSFLEDYINHKKGISLLHPKEYKRRYQYSPLQYFHKELGISS